MSSRNRARASMGKEDIADESNLWVSIVDKIRRCNEINKKCCDMSEAIAEKEEEIKSLDASDTKESLFKLDELEKLHREGLKQAEEELRVLLEEPDDLLRNLETLISVRAAFETEVPRSATSNKTRAPKRRIDADGAADSPGPASEVATPAPSTRLVSKGISRSGSVAAPSIKSENGTDVSDLIKAPVSDKLGIDSIVFYRAKGQAPDAEGILCRVTNVTGEGKHRRYEVQDEDPDPDENGLRPGPKRASIQSLVLIPPSSTALPDFQKGQKVIAMYPETTTFYKAKFVSKKGNKCQLRFEGETDINKMEEVERRLVLDMK